jgi:hypothetical protein
MNWIEEARSAACKKCGVKPERFAPKKVEYVPECNIGCTVYREGIAVICSTCGYRDIRACLDYKGDKNASV